MKRILVIDDDPAVQSLTVKALRARGFETLTAEDGLAGLEMARKHLPDMIICDIQMPNLDGYGTLAALQQDTLTSTIPFIFLTGLTDRTQIRQGMGLGADDYLTKPFTASELISAVNTRLGKRAALQRRSEKKLEELRGNIGLALPHEMLTPLNGILGFAALMMDEDMVFEPREIQDFARNINISALRLHRLIENFIIYSELELAASDPAKIEEFRKSEPILTSEIVARVASEKAGPARREADLSLNVKEAAVAMSPTYFKKAVEELVDNAVKFSKAGSPIKVSSGPANRQFALSISDRGRGMTPGQIADVGAHMQFERRFYEQQGVGLGLIIAKRLAVLHGGDLTIESTPGEYTTVCMILPLAGSANNG
jgi:signal transduction histidine kinase